MALRLTVDRLLPRGRSAALAGDGVELPALARAADLLEACREVIAAAAAGRISVGDAQAFVAMLESQRKLIETEELAVRIEALESAKGKGKR